jgi:hypothetical protein
MLAAAGRAAVLLAALAGAASPAEPSGVPAEFVQAVDFPYYLYPRDLWERELVWLKNIGIDTVRFSVPWNWHQTAPGTFDFTGATSPRRDVMTFVRMLRRLGLRGWVRLTPPVDNWPNRGWPAGVTPANSAAAREWIGAVSGALAAHTANHGGAIAFADGGPAPLGVPAPPAPVTVVSAGRATALADSRELIATAHGSLAWSGVEDALYPEGWAPVQQSFLVKGVVGLSGDERSASGALRREAALLHVWGKLLGGMRPAPMPKPASGRLPEGVTAVELVSRAESAVCITNRGAEPFHDELRVLEPATKRTLVIPNVTVPPGDSLWLPVSVTIGPNGLCRDCSNFSGAEQIVYATAELLSVEYENGILAMEFAAPEPGEAILQLEREPVGPFLASGKPTRFDWDDKAMRARLTIPANPAPGNRVRIGIAIEEPETSAFFNEAKRLIIGAKNLISTAYSSAEVAARSRLRLPEGFAAAAKTKSPNEIDYEVTVPAGAPQGDYANFAIEADGLPLGRARLQLFRPVSIRVTQAVQIHFGQHTELAPDPPTVPVEPKAGTNIELSLRNNWPSIQTYKLEAAGDGLEFYPPKSEITIGPMDRRTVSLRVFGADGASGVCDWHLKVSGGASFDLPMRAVLAPRNRTVAWTADLDGDGTPEWVLESQKARAIFSSQDGGRWMEFTWKDSNVNFLPEQGILAGAGPVQVRANGDSLELIGKDWTRTVRLVNGTVTIEQSTPLSADGLSPWKQGSVTLSIARESESRVSYSLH